MECRIRFVRRALFDDVLKEAVFFRVNPHHAAQGCGTQSRLFSVRNHSNCLFDTRDFSGQENGCDDVRACEPERFFASEVIDSDILGCAVVNGPHGQNVIVGTDEREESNFDQNLRSKHRSSVTRERSFRISFVASGNVTGPP